MKIGLLGINGRMGQILNQELLKEGHHVIELSFELENLKKQLVDCDAAIEFSSSDGLKLLVEATCKPLVLASTGLNPETICLIQSKSNTIPIFYSANYSWGLFKLLEILKSSGLAHDNALIHEIHHIQKKDKPSGTALFLQKELGIKNEIKSHRENEVFGTHKLIYQFEGEQLEFSHSANHRKIFALGAIKALKFLMNKGPGLYSMHDLLAEDSNKSEMRYNDCNSP